MDASLESVALGFVFQVTFIYNDTRHNGVALTLYALQTAINDVIYDCSLKMKKRRFTDATLTDEGRPRCMLGNVIQE